MELSTTLESLNYQDIHDQLIPFKSEKNLDQLKHLYIEVQTELKFKKSVINAAVIYALRLNKDKQLPTNNYIKKTLLSNFKFCKNASDAADVLLERITYEMNIKNNTQKVKDKPKVKSLGWEQSYLDELDNEPGL